MLKIGSTLSISVNGKTIESQLVGIDSYTLENFEGKTLKWQSYTLTSNKLGTFARFWITDWKSAGWILWTGCKQRKNLKALSPVVGRSGIGKIEFSGDKGVSTPTAALAVYSSGKDAYYAMERFADSAVMLFQGRKTEKPKARKTK